MTFDRHDAGVTELLNDPGTLRFVTREAASVADLAGELAPDGKSPAPGVKRSYRSTRAVPSSDGATASVHSRDPFGHLVEFGSVNNPTYAPIRRAIMRRGARIRMLPR